MRARLFGGPRDGMVLDVQDGMRVIYFPRHRKVRWETRPNPDWHWWAPWRPRTLEFRVVTEGGVEKYHLGACDYISGTVAFDWVGDE